MTSYKQLGLVLISAVFLSCNGKKGGDTQHVPAGDSAVHTTSKVVYEDSRAQLQLSVADTIIRNAAYYFSDPQVKDLFVLKVFPGAVKDTKAELQILTAAGKVIYSQSFDAFYFVRGIYEPDTIPTNSTQDEYEAYMKKYWKALKPQQFEAYFHKGIDSFFTSIYPIDRKDIESIKAWKEDIDKDAFYKEVIRDKTIKLIDITCYDCSEGGVVIGYSRKENKVIPLVEHD